MHSNAWVGSFPMLNRINRGETSPTYTSNLLHIYRTNMVLHNSKWDRRATRKYQQKHGLTKEDLQKERELRKNQKNAAKNSVDEQDESEGEEVNKDKKENGEEEVSGLEIEDDNSEEDGEEEDEEEYHFRSEADLWPEDQLEDEDGAYRELAREAAQKKIQQMQQNYTTSVKVFSNESDIVEFERIQKEVERARLKNDITRRFGRKAPVKLEPIAPNTAVNKLPEDDFDSFLEEIDTKLELDQSKSYGVASRKLTDKQTTAPITQADWTSADNFL